MKWTSLAKAFNKPDFMTRAKGMKRVTNEIDVVKLIRKLFVLNVLKKHLILPAKMASIRKKGKFIIEPDYLQGHKLSSEDSEAGAGSVEHQEQDATSEQVSHNESENHSAKHREESKRAKYTSAQLKKSN